MLRCRTVCLLVGCQISVGFVEARLCACACVYDRMVCRTLLCYVRYLVVPPASLFAEPLHPSTPSPPNRRSCWRLVGWTGCWPTPRPSRRLWCLQLLPVRWTQQCGCVVRCWCRALVLSISITFTTWPPSRCVPCSFWLQPFFSLPALSLSPGALTCTKPGAIGAQPNLEQVQQLFDESKTWYNFW